MSLVTLVPIARSQAPILDNLFALYAHDFSEHVTLPLHDDGTFGVSPGDVWWTAEGHHPYFIRDDGELVGFALLRRGSKIGGDPSVMDVAEFFVARGARKRNVGTRAALLSFATYPGAWEVRVRATNPAAHRFWRRAVAEACGRTVPSEPATLDGVAWHVFRFDARARATQAH